MKPSYRNFVVLAALGAALSASAGSFDDFFRAVKSDDASSVRSLVQKGFDPNTRDAYSQTGLLIAIKEPSPRVFEVLLASPKTNVDALNSKDESPLMLAALKGTQEQVNALLQRDAAVNKTGWAPLHYAATTGQVAIMKQLLDKFAFIDAQSPNGSTPLMMAAMYGTGEAVKLLLDEGADMTMKNEQGMTAADFAARAKRPDAVKLLAAAKAASRSTTPGKW